MSDHAPSTLDHLNAADPPREERPGRFRPGQPLLSPVVVGRDDELAHLVARLDDAAAGRGGVVALVGDAGVGKSRLCREIAERATTNGTRVLAGRAVPGDTPVPYRPLTEALVGAFRDSPLPAAPELEGFHGHLGRLVPAWRREASAVADESAFLLGEAVVRVLRVLGATNGCVLVLEDLHWADTETMAIVDYLGDALRHERALVLCTSRPTATAHELVARLRGRDATSALGVEPLDAGEVARVVRACLGSDEPPSELVEFAHAHSEGLPFLVEELLAGLVAANTLTFDGTRWIVSDELRPTVPFSFADSIRKRLLSLRETERHVLGAAAVLGRRFDWELVPGVAEVDGRAVVDALRRGVDEQLIEVDGSGFRFRHALTREAVLRELLPPERRDLARRAWPAVERAHPGLPGPLCELAAELAEMAGDLSSASARLRESAARALATGAFTTAEATARKAIRLAPAGSDEADDADEVLVQTLALAGKPEEATRLGRALVERFIERGVTAERRAGLLVILARAAVAAGDPAAAREMSDRARELVEGGEVDASTAARVDAVASHAALDLADLDRASSLARSALELARATEQPAVQCEALEVLGRVDRASDRAMARRWFEESAAIAETHGLTTWLLRARHELALGDWADGRQQPLLAVRELAVRHGALVTVAVMDLGLADFALSSFDRDGCLAAATRCVDASRRFGLATRSVAELWLAGAHALFGHDAEMEAGIDRALERDPDDPRILGDAWGRVRAARAMVADDRDALRAALDKQVEYARIAPVTTSVFPNRILWAAVHVLDDADHGRAALEEVAAATNLFILPHMRDAIEMLDAVSAGRTGDPTTADRFEAASSSIRRVAIAAGMIEYVHLLAAEAAIRDGWGNPAAWLRRAEAFFADGGYDLIARRCRSLLVQAGAPAPRRGRGESVVPPELRALGITSRELDVLNLVAEGLSNREIGERLFLSPKTVGRHLSSLFDRTGIRDRVALGQFARTQTGSPPSAN